MSSHSAIAVGNTFIEIHQKKRIGVLNSKRLIKYIHIADITCAALLNRRLVEDLTLSTKYGPFYESIMRELEGLGNREIPCGMTSIMYNSDGEFKGRFIPRIKENVLIELIQAVYENFCQHTDKEILDFVLTSKMPWSLAKENDSLYIRQK